MYFSRRHFIIINSMNKTVHLDFNRDTSKKKSSLRRVAVALAVTLLLGAAVFVAVLAFNEFSLEKLIGAKGSAGGETTEAVTAAPAYASPFTDANAVNVLVLCHDDDKNVAFCEILSFSEAENSIKIKSLPTDMALAYLNRDYTLAALFADFGVSEIASCLSGRYVIHRSVSFTENAFRQIVQSLGNVPVVLPAAVDFSANAIRYTFPAGPAELSADELVSVMKSGYTGDAALSFRAAALAALLRSHMTVENLSSDEAFYNTLLNELKGNITALDVAQYKQKLIELMSRSPEITAIS